MSELRLIKNALEYLPKDDLSQIPRMARGIYVLYQRRASEDPRDFDFQLVLPVIVKE